MKKKHGVFAVVIILATLIACPVRAELGLKTILAEQGVKAMGLAVLAAAQAVYDSSDDPAVIQTALIGLLDEAAATGDEKAVRYAIIAVLLAGGNDHLDVGKKAVNASKVFSDYPELTAKTVAEAQALMASGGAGVQGSGQQQGGGQQGGGGQADAGQDKQLGGGQDDERGGGQGRLFLLEIDPDIPFSGETTDLNQFKATTPTEQETPRRETPATPV